MGVTVGFNTIDRNTRAVIGNLSGSGETDQATSISSSGNVKVNAKNDGYIGSFSLASAVSTGGDVTNHSDGTTTGSTSYGVGISGDVAFNEVTDTTEAYLRDVKVTTTNQSTVSVTANNDSEIMAIGGSVALTIGNNYKSTSSLGLAGSYGQNIVSQTTNAYLENTTLTNPKTFTVTATNTSEIYAVVAGGSGAANSDLNTGIAGAVTINEITNTTKAYIANSTTTIAGAITVSATDSSTLHADAGGVALAIAFKPESNAASLSAGVGVSVNDVTNTVSAYVDKSTLTAAGNVAVTATSTGTIDAFALGGAASVSSNASLMAFSFSGAGAGADNDIENTISAYVTNSSTITTSNSGTISITATDNSTITADSGGYSIAFSRSSASASGSVGVAIANNDIQNTISAYVDQSTLNSTGAVDITAQSTAEIDALSIGGSAAGSSGYLGSLSISGAGAGTTNSIDNKISAQVKNTATITTSNNAAVTVKATDGSLITADAGGVVIAGTLGNGSSASLSIGASIATNKIGLERGHTIQALVDNATINAAGNVGLTASSTATIDGLAFSGAAAVSGSTGGGNISLAGSGTGIENTIKATIAAGIQNGGKVTTVETVTLTATDDSEITADAGAASLAIGVSGDGSGAVSIGVAIANNEINNTVKAFVDKGTVTAGDLNLSASSSALIDTKGIAGAVSVAASGGASLSGAGAGTGVTNTLRNTIQSYIQNGSTITTKTDANNGGDLNFSAIDDSTIESVAIGGSIAISGSTGAAFSLAIGAVTMTNTIDNTVQSFIGQNSTDSTSISAGDDIALTAQSKLTMTQNTAVAASLSAGVAPTSASFSGAGASVTTTTTSDIAAFIRNVNTSTNSYNVQAADAITLTANDASNLDPTIGSGALVASMVGASVGVSITDTTVNNTVQAYIDNAKVSSTNGNLSLTATSSPDIDALAVATSVAASIGGAGAGAEATATVKSTVEARIGSGSSVKAKTINVTADSTDDVTTDAYGTGAGVVAIGAAVADSKTQSTTKAHVTGAQITATNLNISSTGDGKVDAGVMSLAGGVWASGSGNSADATFDSTVQAYIGDSTTVTLTGNLNITATAQPDVDATAFGLSVSGLLQVGYSAATAEVTPQIDAYIGNGSTISASNLTLLAQQSLPTSGDAAYAKATGSGGAVFGSLNASESTATNSGQVSAYVGKYSNLTITNTASIKTDADSQQTAEADGYNAGALALGNNIASAESSLTTQAYLDNGVNVTAKDLKIQAIGNDYNYANAIAGGGGVISGQAATGSTDSASTAKVRIEDGDTTSGNVEIKISNAIDILADQTTKFNSKANSVNASVVGGSGAYTENTVNSTASVTIGVDPDNTVQNLVINAASLTVNAIQTILKPELVDETAESASGGVIDAPAASSTTTINNSTTITIGDSSTSNNFDTTISTTGDITLNALNTVYAWDDTLLDSGGVVSVARSNSKVEQKTNEAVITIQDANLYSDGEITLSTRAEVEFDVTASASSYGVAGVPSAYSTATTNTKNQIQLKNGAYLRSEKDVNLLAGQNADGDTNVININARSNVWNYTAAPISSAGSSDASVTLENTITIDAGAQILTVNDTNLLTTEGDVEAVGVLKSQDGYEELVGNLSGASVADIKRTVDNIKRTTGVTVNGTVEVSIENQETLTIDESLNLNSKTTVNGVSVYPINITQQTDGIGTVTLSVENVYNTISQRILQLKELKAAYAGDVSTVASYTSEIEYWEIKLAELGSVTQVTYIDVPDITVKVGDIRVTGDYLKGSGLLNSPGDAKILITNGSPYYLRVNDLNIPEIAGGRILFNTASVTSNATINSRNTSGNTANFSQITTSASSDEALISVENTYDPTFAVQKSQFTALGVSTPAAPDLEVLGSVSNFKGTVRLTNDEGSIVVTGSLNAKTIDINSGSDFVLSDNGTVFEFNPSSKVNVSNNTITIASHGLKTGEQVFYQNGGGTSIGGLINARSYFAIVVDSNTIKLASTETDASANKAIDLTSVGSGTQSLSLTDDLGFLHVGGDPRSQLSGTASTYETGSATTGSSSVDPSSASSITASNNVFINARYLNINGVIQSGMPDRSLTLSDTLNSTIFGFKFSYDLARMFGGTPSTKYLTLSTDTDGTGIDAKYNAETNRIELDNVSIEGGYMQLTGHILSTGDGNLKVMDGFGRINIVNNTSFDIALNSIDTGGSGIEGKLKIIDTARTGADGEALVTTYTHVGNNVTITDTSISGGKTTTTSNSRSASYSPLANQRYTWVTGQSSLTETVKTYAKSNVWGIDELAKDPGTEIESHTTLLDETPLLEGTYVETGTSSNLYNYSREVVTTSNSQLVDQDTWKTTSGWWVFKSTTYYRRDTYQKGQKTINTHSYKADSPIAVTFVGYDTGSISVTSTSNILILDSVTNEGGTTTLKSTSGYIGNLSTAGTITSNSLVLSGSKLEGLKTDVNQLQFTATGDVSITDTAGDVTISGESYSSSGKVTLSTEGSLLSAGAGTYDIKGYAIDLTSESGSIGSSTRSLRVNSGIKTNATLSTADGVSGLTLDAADDIYLEETDGDLYLVSAKAGSNITLNVTKGGLIDNNLSETLDPYSQAQLESLWSQVGLTTDRSSKAIASFKQQAEQLYDTYWNYRNVKSSVNAAGQIVYTADDYNANFSYSYSDTAKAQLRTLGYTDSAIAAMAAEKTAQHHTLHQLFSGGSVTLTGNDAYISTVITDLFKDSDFTGKNLTTVSTYSPTLIESKYNVSTSQQGSLSQGSKWSLDQLKNTVAAGLFGSVTDTQYMVEDPNITAGGDITITTSGGVGRAEGTVVIDNWSSIKNWATDLTEAQRLALSYAERDDITYYDASGNKISDLSKSGTSIAKVSISLKQDVDINTTGEINLTAGGNVFLGSEQDINLDQVKAGSEVRIKAAKGIVNVAASGAVNVTSGGDLVLEAGSASIGTSTTPITIDLKDNAYYYNGKLYLLSSSATWETAQTYAQSLGGNLITINDATEEAWLKSTFGSTESFWIGLTDKVTEGTFAWANGETTTYRNWAAGEPNNSNNEDYVSMNFGSNRQWNDNSSTATMRGIVEIGSLGANLTARAKTDIYVANSGNLNISEVYAGNILSLSSTGGIIDANNNADANLQSDFLTLTAPSVGTPTNAVDFADDTEVKLNTTQNVYLQTLGDLSVDVLGRTSGTVNITGDSSNNIITLYSSSDSLNSTIDISINGGSGSDTLIVKPTRTGGTWDQTNRTITGTGLGTIAYSNIETVKITPVAGNDSATTTEATSTTFTVLGNDVDFYPANAIAISEIGGTSVTAGQTVTLTSGALVTFNANNSFTYNPNGKFEFVGVGKTATDTFTYGVTNSSGGTDTATVTVTIAGINDAPTGVDDSLTTDEATTLTISALSNDFDTDIGDTLSITHANGTAVSAGSILTLASGAKVTFNADGTFSYNPNGKFEYLGIGKTATDSFQYTISDGKGGTSIATINLTITGVNDAPTAKADSVTTTENSTVTFAVLGNDSDIDVGDTLSVTKINGVTLSAGSSVLIDSKAKVTLNANGTLTYDPNGKFEYLGKSATGTDSFTYTISDSKGGVSTATINLTITGENDAPTANADSVTTNEDISTTFSILSNDFDIDTGDTISISRINGKVMVPGSTITLTSGAKLTYHTNRTFTYNPNGKFAALNMGDTATDSFTYTIVDGKGGSSTATATITIKGGSFFERTGSSNPFNGVDVGYNSNITFADLDKDGDLDAFMAASEGIRYYQNTNGSFTQVTGTSNPLNGVSGASISFADIDKDGDLDAFVGDAKLGINYYQNNNGKFSLVTGAKNPFNNISDTIAPSFIDIDNDGDLDAFAGSIDGTIKFYRNTNGSFAQVTGSANPFNGVDFGDDTSISFADVDLDGDLDAFIGKSAGIIGYYSNTNGNFAPSSSNPFNGVDVGQNATIAFADINGDGDLDAFIGEFDGNFNYFENVNTAPVASADSTTTNEDTAITFSTLSNDSDANVADTLSITKVNGTSMTAGSSISLTSGAKVTLNANKTFTYSPNGKFEYLGSGKSATDSFTYSISDGRGGISTATVSLTITGVNDAPVTVADSATTDEDTTTTISVLSNDYDMDTDTFSITQVNGAAISSGSTITLGSGAKLTINSNGTFTYNPNGKFSSLQSGATGSDSFTYTISDGKGGTSTATVSLSITGLTFRERTGTANPFTGLDVGDKATPAFADIDKDGDLDAFVGSSDGTIRYYRNTNGSFTQVTGTANPFNGITWGNNSSISFADIDRDGDLDAFISGTKGGIGYYQNTNGVFTLNTNTTLFPGLTFTTNAPTFADIDGDGDLDAFITNASSSSSTTGSIAFYRNTNGSFTQVTGTANPFNGMSIGVNTRYDFADLDKDGDLDMFVGDDKVGAAYYRNTNGSFSYESGANPFANISGIGSTSAIIFADIDKDGDSDAIFGQQDGTLKYLENK
ncbi:Ig-like domain-containing protein [Leptolyngbya sp. FACHB-17]|uniref:Ig-like domain-containing protein n=1 Tax=unclassified Leptolyngbya TaxID=2650499 RepID=UPI001F55732D|nr:Ig-like domain-containing protein [Leptolyngbya sp. FACHB-17]